MMGSNGMTILVEGSLQPYSRINQAVGNVGQYQADDVKQGSQKNHGAYHREILGVDRVDGVTAQPGNTEKRFRKETAKEQQRDDHDRPGEYGNHRIPEHMPEQYQ